jgi:hypothetical protein
MITTPRSGDCLSCAQGAVPGGRRKRIASVRPLPEISTHQLLRLCDRQATLTARAYLDDAGECHSKGADCALYA